MTVIDAEVSTVSGAADKILQVRDDPPWLLHLELQTRHETGLAARLQWYNTLVSYRHKQSVRTALVLLQREADSPSLTGTYQQAFPGEQAYLEFRYRVIRVWQTPVDAFLTGGLGTLPLAPLAAVGEAELAGVIRRMEARLDQEAPERAGVLWTVTYILLGLRCEEALITQLLQGVRAMKESVTYQAILREGRAEGRVEGRAEGARALVLRLGQRRLGPPDEATRSALEGITDFDRLERMGERLVDATVPSWSELLTLP